MARELVKKALVAAVVLAAGCDRSPHVDSTAAPASSSAAVSAGVPAIVQPARPTVALPIGATKAPVPWAFARVMGPPPLALPDGCKTRGPILRAETLEGTRWTVEPRTLRSIAIAEPATSPSEPGGRGILSFDASGTPEPAVVLPWAPGGPLPHLARAGGGEWLGAFQGPGEAAGARRVALLRAGGLERVGEGDAFDAVDLVCSGARCALLTTREAKVAGAGAELWVGSIGEPFGAWQETSFGHDSEPPLKPFAVGWIGADPGSEQAVAALLEGTDVVFRGAGSPAEVARIAAPYGALDVGFSPALVLGHGGEVDADGCARGEASLTVTRAGAGPVKVPVMTAPISGAVRPLAHGTLLSWIAPVGSCTAGRRVVFSVVLGPDGTPLGKPVPVGDASNFAVSASGDDVDFWVQDGGAVLWLQATCSGAP